MRPTERAADGEASGTMPANESPGWPRWNQVPEARGRRGYSRSIAQLLNLIAQPCPEDVADIVATSVVDHESPELLNRWLRTGIVGGTTRRLAGLAALLLLPPVDDCFQPGDAIQQQGLVGIAGLLRGTTGPSGIDTWDVGAFAAAAWLAPVAFDLAGATGHTTAQKRIPFTIYKKEASPQALGRNLAFGLCWGCEALRALVPGQVFA
ncbi:hypothetical protein V498_05376 [Pseudogymnoascus sp. VKM F-4517 (FW-2822)]|nr:hypothetical protein V498_05376 [Pseudogymnoascus sp. VKM F-4517 (FW-2822)]